MALEDAGLDPALEDPTRIGAVIGATGTGYAPDMQSPDEYRILRNMANAPASWISLKEKILGPAYTVSTACSSGTYALHAAFLLIASGECDMVVAGASDSSINYPDVSGFCSLRALSERNNDCTGASQPFDRNRDGFVMGEGSGMLVVESMEHARERHANIRALMPLPALASESYNILSPQPDGTGMAKAMQRALINAGLAPSAIDYLNAHGTSTPLNDRFEAQAIQTVFGAHARNLPVSSTKSMTGHCLSAAAAVEAVISCMSLATGIIPPTINLTEPDSLCDLDHVALHARHKKMNNVMSNSFAFGGHNGVAIFSRHE
jgi:3-oxoacyl-[acyl-carrier-protein] synthase II